MLQIEYHEAISMAESEGEPCTKPGMDGDKLRAGQFWDEERNVDTRAVTPGSQDGGASHG